MIDAVGLYVNFVEPGGISCTTKDLVDLTTANGLLDVLDAWMVLSEVLMDPRGVTIATPE